MSSKLEKVLLDLRSRGADVKIVACDGDLYVSAIWSTGRRWLVQIEA